MNTRRHPILQSTSSAVNLNNYHLKTSHTLMQTHANKQNVATARNVHRQQSSSKDERRLNSKRKNIFTNKQNVYSRQKGNQWQGTQSCLSLRSNSSDIRKVASTILNNNAIRMTQSQQMGQSVQSRRKKSVRFSEQKLEVLEKHDSRKTLQTKGRQVNELKRNRSSSILKNKVGNSQDLRFKSNSLLKDKNMSQSIDNGFSISEYKNTIVRQRYNQLIKFYSKNQNQTSLSCSQAGNYKFTQRQSKYTDNNFLLLQSSIFKNKTSVNTKIKWMRLSELYQGKQVTILRKQIKQSNLAIKVSKQSMASSSFIHFIELIKNNHSLLDKIFQNSSFSPNGVYMLKVFQSHQWKCLIIDDFIPVIEENNQIKPIFTALEQTKNSSLQLWPLLLEKAYASLLGCYEEVHSHSLEYYFVQMLGLPLHRLPLENDKKGWREDLKNSGEQSIVFGYSKLNKSTNECKGDTPKVITIKNNSDVASFSDISSSSKTKVAVSDLKRVFKDIYIIRIKALQYYTSCHISLASRFGQSIKNKKCFSDRLLDINRERPIVKKFKVTAHEQVSLILKRKTNSFISNSSKNTSSWLRVFLLMKETDGYRWIEGRYQAEYLSFSCVVEPGQYFICILPDWTVENNMELTLLVYSRMEAVEIENHSDSNTSLMIEKGCSDYVQRFGSMFQVNKWICTYAMVDQQTGMMIENINNQRRHGKVRVLRSINNLKPDHCHLLPFNGQFYQGGQVKSEVQITMTKEQSYTVILMLFNGIDRDFLGTFNFGI